MSTLPPLGVGLLGAGPVTQAIHLPTLTLLADLFRVVHVADVDPAVAAAVAGRVRARHSSSGEALLADPEVDVVAVCSPHAYHAEHVVAACRAGVKAVLCEKPLATDVVEAEQIAAVAAETGTPVLVGAMHAFDPGWLAAQELWGDAGPAGFVRSSIVLPPNSRFEEFATEMAARPPGGHADLTDAAVAAARVRGGVLGLATHDLPLIRALLSGPGEDGPVDAEVLAAHALAPFGYRIALATSGALVELHAVMTRTWRPDWVLEAWSVDAALHVRFTPSYVHAGSAVPTLSRSGVDTTVAAAGHNGYVGEWQLLADVARGAEVPPAVDKAVDDLRFALTIADAAAARMRRARPAAEAKEAVA